MTLSKMTYLSKFIKCCLLLITMITFTNMFLSCDRRNSQNENIELINIDEEIYAGNQFYDKDDYQNAIRHYVRAYKAGKEDGIILYRVAYSAEQISGLNEDVKILYRYALELLKNQYPEHKYFLYAKNKVSTFTNAITGIAENGDIYNFDNDGDGRREPIFVSGYFRKDGTYVRSHYRARPR